MAQAFLPPAPLLRLSLSTNCSSIGCTTVRKFGLLRHSLSFASSLNQAFHMNARTRKAGSRVKCFSIRSEQSTNESQGASVWLGRAAMIGFATAIILEVSTGKGLLENIGLATPQLTLALFVTALVIGLVALFLFQSASRE